MVNINTGKINTPVAIVVAGALIAVAVFISNNKLTQSQQENKPQETKKEEVKTVNIPGVQPDDHIVGSPDAKIVIVEYSDTECPFCKKMHETLKQITDKHSADGSVAWVYRQLPLPQLHPTAPKQAQATECAAYLGGNEAFWKFTNKLFEETPANNGLDMSKLPDFAEFAGLDRNKFEECLNSDIGKDVIEKHTKEAIAATGGRLGTPYNVILFNDTQTPVPGYLPFEAMDNIIHQMLEQQSN